MNKDVINEEIINENNECALTTIDNPFDPFTQFDDWFNFDNEKGYNSCSKLDRVVELSDEMSEVEVNQEIERGIDEIIKYDFLNVYKKVTKSNNKTTITTE